jgi:hypothetical protein
MQNLQAVRNIHGGEMFFRRQQNGCIQNFYPRKMASFSAAFA